jgi:hypothetical protein
VVACEYRRWQARLAATLTKFRDWAEYGPKSRVMRTNAQVRGVARWVCKSVGLAYPGSNPGPATPAQTAPTSDDSGEGLFRSCPAWSGTLRASTGGRVQYGSTVGPGSLAALPDAGGWPEMIYGLRPSCVTGYAGASFLPYVTQAVAELAVPKRITKAGSQPSRADEESRAFSRVPHEGRRRSGKCGRAISRDGWPGERPPQGS